jgi:hypothetical protein
MMACAMAGDLGAWDPLSPGAAARLLAGCPARWWIAGGWAIDLLAGRATRPHGDLDVLVLRADQHLVRRHLWEWDLQAADPPGHLRRWPVGETLPAAVHDIWCRLHPSAPWSLQLMLDDTDGDDWVYRRDRRIRRPIGSLAGRASTPDMPVLSAEVQLLYKSRTPRPKDESDLALALPLLTSGERAWLDQALRLTAPRSAGQA